MSRIIHRQCPEIAEISYHVTHQAMPSMVQERQPRLSWMVDACLHIELTCSGHAWSNNALHKCLTIEHSRGSRFTTLPDAEMVAHKLWALRCFIFAACLKPISQTMDHDSLPRHHPPPFPGFRGTNCQRQFGDLFRRQMY